MDVPTKLPILHILSVKDGYQLPSFMLPESQSDKPNTNQEQQELDNLVGFFDLLLKIDMRTNPELYQKEQSHD